MQFVRKYKKGLALSGGGARGIAHLGAAKALYEAGHKFDIISGTSMGAIVGCLLADGHQPDDLIKLFTPANTKQFIRPGISKNGMMTMDGARKFLKELLTVRKIEDLAIPFVAAATHIHTGATAYFDKGDIIDSVIASSSIPVVFPPAKVDGELYIDGGVLNNLPVRNIRQDCRKVFGFHVNPQSLGLHKGKVDGIAQIAERSFHLCMLGNVLPDIELCDFYLEHSELSGIATFDFNKAEFIFEEGYRHTQEALNKLKK